MTTGRFASLAALTVALTAPLQTDALRAAEAPAPSPSVLFLSTEPHLDSAYTQSLAAAGIQLASASLYDPLAPAFFRKFNVFVIDKLPIAGEESNVFGQHMIPFRANLSNVWACVQAGAGALVYPNLADNGGGLCLGWNEEMKPFGIRILQACVCDRSLGFSTWRAYGENYYAWTDNLVKHPTTEGLRRLYYATANLRWDDCYATPPLVGDASWTALVKAMKGARVGTQLWDRWIFEPDASSEPVLAAVRSYGAGRLAALAINPTYIHRLGTTKLANNNYGEMSFGQIDGMILSKGDGATPSDTGAFVNRLYAWLAADSATKGFGGYKTGEPAEKTPPVPTDEEKAFTPVLDFDAASMPVSWRHRPTHIKIDGKDYYPEFQDPFVVGELKYFRALIGAHTVLSDGKGTVAEYAAAAKRAGYSLLVFTEAFEELSPNDWEQLVAECAANSSTDFVCLPGFDILDPDNNRMLVIAPPYYPRASWLSADGKRLVETQVVNLLYGNHLVVAHRPSTGPLPQERLKHFQGFSVFTYRGGKLVDDSLQAYAWQVMNASNPHALAIHEIFSPAEIAAAAATGFQQVLPAGDISQAASYFRTGIPHYFEAPARYLITEGPLIDTLAINPKDIGPAEENRRHFRVDIGITNDLPLASVTLYDGFDVVRRWTPKGNTFRARVDFQHSKQFGLFLVAQDVKGRRVISPSMRTVADRYHFRCSDRQNWLGHVGAYYTGTRLPDHLDLFMPVKDTAEASRIFTDLPGSCLAAKLNFPFSANDVVLTETLLDETYVTATFREVGYDAMPSRASKPSSVYAGKSRRWSFSPGKPNQPHVTLVEFDLALRRTVEPRDPAGLFPGFGAARSKPFAWRTPDGKFVAGELNPTNTVDVPVGGLAGGFIALSGGLRMDRNTFGLAPAAGSPASIPAGTRFTARFLVTGTAMFPAKVDDQFGALPEAWLTAMGLNGKTPYTLALTRGKLDRVAFLAEMTPDRGGVAGDVRQTADIPYRLPLQLRGLNPRWPAGLWREGDAVEFSSVFENTAWPRLDVAKKGRFYAGNLLMADDPALVLEFCTWTPDRIRIEVHNPTDRAIETTIATPAEITGLKAFRGKASVPPGTTVYLE